MEPHPDDPEARRALEDLDALLDQLPWARKVVNQLRELQELMVHRRPPRLAAIGRRGCGKSSLANAFLGRELLPVGLVEDTTQEALWADLMVSGRALRWLDTPGLRAGASPTRLTQVTEALLREPPDVVLALFRATQVDASIDDDLSDVRDILERLKARRVTPRLLAVVTRVDELLPRERRAPPYEDEAKATVLHAADTLREHLKRRDLAASEVVPVCTWQRFQDGERVTDWRWNLEALARAVGAVLPRPAQVELARAAEQAHALRRSLAMRYVKTATGLSFLVGATTLPIADLALLLPLQTTMVTWILYVSGKPLGPRSVSEWLAALGVNLGAGVGLREGVRALLKLVPGLGAAVSGGVAATGTWALGIAAVRYFIDNRPLAEVRRDFEAAGREGPPEEGTSAPPGT
ncbi:MAG: 50S ribosome-binding GTPase [Deltaproteobacteria bacterium]|nr:50S ribosome-binding GTPase [Deltaproteobacteria bacterium]